MRGVEPILSEVALDDPRPRFSLTCLLEFAQNAKGRHRLGKIEDLVRGGSDKHPPTLSNRYIVVTSPFSQENIWSKCLRLFILGGSTEPSLDPPQPDTMAVHISPRLT